LINVASKNVLDDIQLSLSMGYSLLIDIHSESGIRKETVLIDQIDGTI
jgi:hypothetical protein